MKMLKNDNIIRVGDVVLTTNKCHMTGKKVPAELVKITEVYSCNEYFKGVYVSDNEPCILFDTEIDKKVNYLKLVK